MDKIYSRKRLYLPMIKNGGNYTCKKQKKLIIAILFLIIIFASMIICINAIDSVLDNMCRDKVRSKATIISNNKATEVMQRYEYDNIMTIHRDSNNDIQMISADIKTINKIISDVAVEIQEEINNQKEDYVSLNLGTFTGMTLFASIGPTIPIKICTIGSVKTSYTSEFSDAGVNQTLHRIYLNVVSTISIVTPYNVIEEPIENQVILMENVIVGKVPESYYNFNGIEDTNLLDMVK